MSITRTETLTPALQTEGISPEREPSLAESLLRNTTCRAALIAVIIIAGGVLIWNFLATAEIVSPLILAPPGAVFEALQNMIVTGSLWPNLYTTAYETIVGFLAAALLATTVSFLFVFSESLQKAVYPMLIIIQTFPKVAIAPMIIAAFGYGIMPKIVLAALMAFFPILVNAMVGLTNVSEDQLNLFRSMKASRWEILRRLRIPNAVSYILPALNTAAVLALIGTIVAEFVSARQGLGFAIQAASQTGAVASTYALLIVLGCFGCVIWLFMALLNLLLKNYRQ